MDNIYKAVQLTIDSQNLALSKTPTHVYIANQYVDTNDTPLITAPFIIQKALENGAGVVDIVSSTIGSIYEVRLLCDAEVLISGYFYMPPMNVNFSELELYTSYPPRTPPVVNEFWQKTENFILEKTNTLLNFVQVFNSLSSMRLSLGYLEELLTTKKSNLVSAINEIFSNSNAQYTEVKEGISDLNEFLADYRMNGWTDQLILLSNGRTQKQKNAELVTPFDFGAIGDGVYHKLSEKYAKLDDAKKKYPTAQSLDDSIDLCALEAFFDYCHDNLVNANITLNAYVNRPLTLGTDRKTVNFKTKVYNGDLTLTNNQTNVEIPYLMIINTNDTTWTGKMTFQGNGATLVKDRKQLGGLVISDGGTYGNGGRTQLNNIYCNAFKNFGVLLSNHSIFPRIDNLHCSVIGSRGDVTSSDGNHNHIANVLSYTSVDGQNNQYSTVKVDSLPPILNDNNASEMVMFEGDSLPYRIQQVNVADSTIQVYPRLNNNITYKKLSYIYGAGIWWVGNNSGAGNFGHLQFILCGIGFWGHSLYGANINYLSTEFCGVGLTLSSQNNVVIGYNVNNSYFEGNLWDYVQQWGNTEPNMLNITMAHGLNIDRVAEIYSWRVGMWGEAREQDAFNASAITLGTRRYDIQPIYSNSVDLSDPRDFINIINSGGDLLLEYSNKAINEKFGLHTKTLVITQNQMPWVSPSPITIKVPEGWSLNGVLNGTLTTNPQKFATVLTVVQDSGGLYNNKLLYVYGDSLYKTSGTTAERPSNAPTGFVYIDTTLNKPIYKTATGWVDATGTVV